MSAFGLSETGKSARSRLEQIPSYYMEEMLRQLGISKEELDGIPGLRNAFEQYLQQQMEQGFGTPEDIAGLGSRILPGVEGYNDSRSSRTQRLRDVAGALPNAAQVRGEMSGVLDQYGNSLTGDFASVQGDINDTFNRVDALQSGRERDIVGSIGDSYGAAQKAVTDTYKENIGDVGSTYGGLQTDAGNAYTDMLGSLDPAYAESQSRLDLLKPGSDARAARVARSYAPALASTVSRLRRAGIDPSSPEGSAALSRVETARARGMDDSLAADTERYVSGSNALTLNKLAQQLGLKSDQLNTKIGLGTNRLNTALGLRSNQGQQTAGLALGQGQDFRNEMVRRSGEQTASQVNRLGANVNNQNQLTANLGNYFNQRMSLPGVERDMALQDYTIQSGLEDRANADDTNAINLILQRYGIGAGHQTADLSRKDVGGLGLNTAIQGRSSRGNAASGMAGQFGGAAEQGFGNVLDREQANSNWLGKLIGSVGGAALNYFLPGSGSIVSGAMGGGSKSSSGGGGILNTIKGIGGKLFGGGGSSVPSSMTNRIGWAGAGNNPYGIKFATR